MGFLKNLFASKEAKFREQVLAVLQQLESRVVVQPGSTDLLVSLEGIDLDLRRLFDACQANETQSPELIRQYFSYPISLMAGTGESFENAESKIRPQLVPAEFASRFGILQLPFAGDVAVGLMLREGGYLRARNAETWRRKPEELLEIAIRNLDGDPSDMEVTITDGTDRFIGMEGGGGFDAARILLPRVREFAEQKLGTPFWAGVPNRDFLILWSRDCSRRFQEYAEEKIETDYSIQPFPLTKARFEVDSRGVRVV